MSSAEAAVRPKLTTMSERGTLPLIIARLEAAAANLFSLRRQTERIVTSQYVGCGWGDSTERRLNDDIADRDHPRR